MTKAIGTRARAGVAIAVVAAVIPALAGSTPAAAQGKNFGVGWMNGQLNFTYPIQPLVEYAPGQAVPVVLNPCSQTAWSFQNLNVYSALGVTGSGGFLLSNALVWYQGFFQQLQVNGGSTLECPDAILGGGFQVPQITGNFATGNALSCTASNGSYDRVGNIVVAQATGSCVTNYWSNGDIGLNVVGVVSPTTIGGGITAPVNQAIFNAGWVAVTL
jgi:hypothetical protein